MGMYVKVMYWHGGTCGCHVWACVRSHMWACMYMLLVLMSVYNEKKLYVITTEVHVICILVFISLMKIN